MNKPVGAAATARQQRMNIATNAAPEIAQLTVDDARTADGVTVTSTLTPRLTTWLPAGRSGEAKVDIEVAHTPPAKTGAKTGKADKPGADQRPIWSSQATAGPGEAQATLRVPKDRCAVGAAGVAAACTQKPGRPSRWSKRQLIDGIRWRVRVGAPWRAVPECYGSWRAVYSLFRRWQRAGIWQQILTRLQAMADARGLPGWRSGVDSTICRAHQHAAGASRHGELQSEPAPCVRAGSAVAGCGAHRRAAGTHLQRLHRRHLHLRLPTGRHSRHPALR
ncbi:transposase [Nonomuraea angiospora]|uniref:transposase n=2 Tax=Nonomuraea angiospora TaxID=46172 RepID=UPI00344E3B5F